ncbi:hypothetical protein V7087_02155 [Neobacillus niacini]|uniref:hypothetical protein n=1 Tax=Neobacillus niacini TaxID=86668 RepID=UPI002FFEC2FD
MDYQVMLYGGLAGAIVSFIITVIVYIKLNISEAIEDLTGFRFSSFIKRLSNTRSKKVQTEKPITNEIKLRRDVGLEVAATSSVAPTELLKADAGDTELLVAEAEETMLLAPAADETVLLTEDIEETTVLSEIQNNGFKKEVDIVIVHSTRII